MTREKALALVAQIRSAALPDGWFAWTMTNEFAAELVLEAFNGERIENDRSNESERQQKKTKD